MHFLLKSRKVLECYRHSSVDIFYGMHFLCALFLSAVYRGGILLSSAPPDFCCEGCFNCFVNGGHLKINTNYGRLLPPGILPDVVFVDRRFFGAG